MQEFLLVRRWMMLDECIYIYIYTYTSRYLKHLDTEFTRWIYPGVGRLDNPAESPRKGRRLVDRLMPIFILWVNMGVGFHDLP